MENKENKIEETISQEEKPKNEGKKRKLIILICAILLVIGGFYAWNASLYQSTDDAYIEAHMIQIAPKVSGEVIETYITDNQQIKEGYLVAKIDDTDYKVRFQQADAAYQKALLGQSVAQANLKAVNSEIELAKKDLERYKKLYEAGAVSKQVLDNAQTRVDGVQAKHKQADEQIISNNENKVIDADIKVLKAMRDQAELQLKYTNVIAPRTGQVTNKRVEKGAFVVAGQPLFAIVPDEVWVVANFKENQIANMKKGQVVEIKVDAYPNKTFKGKIDSIQRASGAKSSLFPPENAVGSFVKIVQRVPVKIVFDEEIDKEKFNIVSGMSVVPKVKVK